MSAATDRGAIVPAAIPDVDSTGVESKLCAILSEHLGGQQIGPDDDFYAMGGDSLIALRVVAEARAQGIAVTLRDLIFYPTARELADIAAATPQPAAPDAAAYRPFGLLGDLDRAMVPAGVVDAWPATAPQLGIIYQCEATGDSRLYHAVIGMTVHAVFDDTAFRAALAELFSRHPALRASFDLGGFSEPMQLVWAGVDPVVVVEPAGDDADADRRMRAWLDTEMAARLDAATPPLVGCHIVTTTGSFRLALSMHHAIVDGWSYARLFVDLLTLYDAKLSGVPANLPEVPIGVAHDLVVAERAAAASPEAAAFWQAEADAPALLAARSRLDPAATDVADIDFVVEHTDLERLRDAARRAGTSLKCYVQGAFARALGDWTGRDRDLVMGCAMNARPDRAGADLVVGLYVATLPVRFPSTRGTWAELAQVATAAERRAAPYLRHPLVQVEQRLGRPAFDVSFNFTNFHVYQDMSALTGVRAGDRWVYGRPGFPVLLDIEVDDDAGVARGILERDVALVDAERAHRLVTLYQEALGAAGRDPFSAPS
jgi:aryl carrier-like protein